MDLQNLNTAETVDDIWMRPLEDAPKFDCAPISFNKSTASSYIVSQNGINCFFELSHPEKGLDLDYLLSRGCAYLAHITNITADGSIQLRLIFFSGKLLEMKEVSIGLTQGLKDIPAPNELIADCRITVENEDYFLLLPSSSGSSEIENFAIAGERCGLVVEKQHATTGNYLWIKKVTRNSLMNASSVLLAHGKLVITSYDDTQSVNIFAQTQLEQIWQSSGRYLKAWDEYINLEGNMLLEKARAIQGIVYTKIESTNNKKADPSKNSYRLFLTNDCPAELSEGDYLELLSEIPSYIANPNMTWVNYFQEKEHLYQTNINSGKSKNSNKNQYIGKVLDIETRSIELEFTGSFPSSGTLFYSFNGDEAQMDRRFKARRAIAEQRCANPLLGLIIEEDGVLPAHVNTKEHIAPLTPFVKEKIFKHDPTVMQEKAIDIALNTPDIALIQGPPGTGKTTVIAAIVERLNQELDPANVRGNILVSGFQHDAVDNLVQRLSVNSLPVIKFGQRSGEKNTVTKNVIIQWREELVAKLRENYPELAPSEQIRIAREAMHNYAASATLENEKFFLELISKLPAHLLNPQDRQFAFEELEKLQKRKNLEASNANYNLLVHVYGLRTSESSYEDDGSFMAGRALIELDDYLDDNDKALLRSFPSKDQKREQYFADIAELKEKLLDKLQPEPEWVQPRARKSILDLWSRVEENIKRCGDGGGINQVVADFLYDLENNPHGVHTALEDFNPVYAATVQQSEGKAIAAAKRRLQNKDHGRFVTYDTVIIDEAARVSPMDLLIPMAQAARRIILVGDHKQLPHIIDEEIARKLEAGEDAQNLKESMFEYLFRRLQKLTEQDKIQRVVTLDAQYRMHPLLGEFVSNAFYDGQVHSPLGEKYFAQNLAGTMGHPVMWLHVPSILGEESRAGTSWQRKAEARAIVSQLKTWMSSEAGRDLTFGVISFYKAQATLVSEIAKEEGLIDANNAVTPQYTNTSMSERLRINTVDAFQGMEFDVVFLSMTRSVSQTKLNAAKDLEKAGLRRFGHLKSENRMCVALSRQKRLLIIVGDKDMVEHDIGMATVPVLGRFLRLCQEQGIVSTFTSEASR